MAAHVDQIFSCMHLLGWEAQLVQYGFRWLCSGTEGFVWGPCSRTKLGARHVPSPSFSSKYIFNQYILVKLSVLFLIQN